MKKKIITVLAFALSFGAFAQDDDSFGSLEWRMSNDTLYISGSGEMQNLSSGSYRPWDDRLSAIKSLVIGQGITSIGDYAFSSCDSLTSVSIPNSLVSIGERAFYLCKNLPSIVLPEGLTSIGEYAFSNCRTLSSVELPNSVTSIGRGAFSGCAKLTSITIPNGVTTIARGMFSSCGLTSISIHNNVTTINAYAFEWCDKLTSITIPNSVDSIGESAFLNCTGLSAVSVAWETPLERIAANAFEGCNPAYIHLIIPDGKASAYAAADVWKEFYIEGISPLPSGECGENLTWTCDFVNGTLSIEGTGRMFDFTEDNAPWAEFRNKINTVVLPNGLDTIGDYAFYYFLNLTSITIPNSVVFIGEYAFSQNVNLRSVTLSNNVATIERYAFSYCSVLTSIEIPNSVTSIKDHAFFAGGLTAIDVSPENPAYTSENGVLFNKAKTVLIRYPSGKQGASYVMLDGVTSIGETAFSVCRGLTSITIANSVTSIGSSAFSYCSGLTSIEIPSRVASISNDAFAYCENLSTIICLPLTPPRIQNSTFDEYEFCVYVMPEALPAYQDANYWDDLECLQSIALEELDFTVTFNSNGGTSVDAQTVSGNSKITKPTDPSKENFTFENWFKDSTFVNAWNFETDSVTSNLTLYAKWNIKTYTIVFNSNGGTSVDSQSVNHGGKITKPADPSKENFTFDGWFKENTFVNAWNFETDTVTSNLTLYAKWNQISAIANIKETRMLSVFPNPVVDELRITNYELRMGDVVEMFDMNGKRVGANLRVRPIDNCQLTINVSHLPAGMYVVKIGTSTGSVSGSAKIVKR